MTAWLSTDHIHKDFWGFVGLFAWGFVIFPGFIAFVLRRSDFFKTYKRLQRDYLMSSEQRRKSRPSWLGIPLVFIGNSSLRFMLSECQKDGFYFLLPSVFFRVVGLRAVAVPLNKVRGDKRVKRLRLKDGKNVVLRFADLF